MRTRFPLWTWDGEEWLLVFPDGTTLYFHDLGDP